MRFFVAAASASVILQCTQSAPESEPSAVPPAPRLIRAADAATGVDPPGPSCVQPAPATPPPPVAAGPAPGCPPDPGGDPNGPIVQVVFPQAGGAVVHAELVSSRQDLQRGLMYRTSLPEDQGMLFDLGITGNDGVWMHDTCIPLDMIFADVDGWIVGIIENAPPLDDTMRGIDCSWRYLLEVNAGWTRAHGVKAGEATTIPEAAR